MGIRNTSKHLGSQPRSSYINLKDKTTGITNDVTHKNIHHSYKTRIYKMSTTQVGLDEKGDKDKAYRLFLASLEACSRHGIKGSLALEVMPKETRFHMPGD